MFEEKRKVGRIAVYGVLIVDGLVLLVGSNFTLRGWFAFVPLLALFQGGEPEEPAQTVVARMLGTRMAPRQWCHHLNGRA